MDLKSLLFQHISQAPTNPHREPQARAFDVADLYSGPAPATAAEMPDAALPLDEKLRQAYFWIVNTAIISPFYDIEYSEAPPVTYTVGDRKHQLILPSGQSYCSFVLLPLLCFAARRKCLLVGGPGRGKTSSAMLMGLLAGYSLKEVRRAIQKGQPQMTVADLLGNPLPADMISAKSMDQIKIAWRDWLGMRVKIIDEYNRIPTRTQSALLTLMADNYAEIMNQTFDCPESAWYLTANDDAGGGTYQVIEALKDRIDVVVKALHFNSRFLGDLLARVEQEIRPEEVVPPQIVFTHDEWDRMHREILAVRLPAPLMRRIEFFSSHFEFADHAAAQFEYKTKDTIKLSAIDQARLAHLDTGKDKLRDIGSQTLNGISVRSLMTLLVFVKSLAYFRGNAEVAPEDVRQMLPFVLHDKLVQNADAPFFEAEGNAVFRTDRIAWLRGLFDMSCAEYDRLDLDRDDPVGALGLQLNEGLEGVSEKEVRARLTRIEGLLREWTKSRKMYGHMYDDMLKLKYMHQRYTNFLRWLTWKP